MSSALLPRTIEDAEEAIRRSEERFRLLVEAVGDYAIYMLDPGGRVTTWNAGAQRIKGYTADEIIGTHYSAFFVPEDTEARKPEIELETARDEGRFEDEGWRVRRDGSRFWANVVLTAIRDARGELVGFAKVTRDLTDRRAAEKVTRALFEEQAARTAAERSEERQRYLAGVTNAINSSLDYEAMLSTLANILVPDLSDWCAIHLLEDGNLRDVALAHVRPEKLDAAHEFQKKYPPDPELPRGLWNVIRTGKPELYPVIPDDALVLAAHDEEHLRALREVGMSSLLMVPIRVRNEIFGAITLAAAESKRSYGREDLLLVEELARRAGTAIDNAKLYASERRARQELQAAVRRAEEASRLKDEFLATVSHELRTPLNAIVGWASLLLRDKSRDPALAKGIEVIFRNAKAQSKIIEDILDVSRIVTGNLRLDLKRASLLTIVNDAAEVVRPSATAKRIALELVVPDDLQMAVVDPERLQQAIWNLLSNAVKFTDPEGRVTLAVALEGADFTITVSDTGRGITPEFLPYVFERFRQADSSTTRRFGGLGLGLAIVRHIIELHGGRVRAESAGVGHGSRFVIRLPIRSVAPVVEPMMSAPDPSERPGPEVTAGALAGVRVLVVDDEADALDLLQMVLSNAGATVKTASSVATALAAFEAFTPDVIVSDIGMPVEDGYGLVEHIRKISSVPAIALTAYTRAEDRRRALAAGFNAHIGKPVNPSDLVLAVAQFAK